MLTLAPALKKTPAIMPRMNMNDMERSWGDRTVQAVVKILERSPYARDEV